MKNCPKCNKEHNNNGKFCSKSCANSRRWTEADKIKKSEAAKNSLKVKESNKRTANDPLKIEKYKKKVKERQYKKLVEDLQKSFDDLTGGEKRIRIYNEQDYRCNSCKNDKWKDQKIPLELEHKDGNNLNNTRDNLELLCPNCHALTDTWRGRNKGGNGLRRNKVSDEKILDSLIFHNWNMRQALIDVGLVAKGNNYFRCHRIKNSYFNISRSHNNLL